MKISDLLKFSLDNLRRRKGRTALTIIGVVVGVCAIVIMVSLGLAVKEATDAMLESTSDLTKITVMGYAAQAGTPELNDAMVHQFKAMDHVVAASPIIDPTFMGSLYGGKNGQYRFTSSLQGMYPDAIDVMGYELVAGTPLTAQQNLGPGRIPVLVEIQSPFFFEDTKKSYRNPDQRIYPVMDPSVSSLPLNIPQFDAEGKITNADEFFFNPSEKYTYRVEYGTNEATGEPNIKEFEFVPVGFFAASSDPMATGNMIMSTDDMKWLELQVNKLSQQGAGGSRNEPSGYDRVFVKADDINSVASIEAAINEIGYSTYSPTQMRNQMQSQVARTQMMLGGLAAVSLFVAALNIANTMTMAIYERTREIGVMKVLGCRLSDIRNMFLIESGTIGLLGGVVGILISLLFSAVLNYLPQLMLWLGLEGKIDISSLFGIDSGFMGGGSANAKLSVIPLWLILLALGFATGVGLLSGIAPANRAVKISSLEAIRHE